MQQKNKFTLSRCPTSSSNRTPDVKLKTFRISNDFKFQKNTQNNENNLNDQNKQQFIDKFNQKISAQQVKNNLENNDQVKFNNFLKKNSAKLFKPALIIPVQFQEKDLVDQKKKKFNLNNFLTEKLVTNQPKTLKKSQSLQNQNLINLFEKSIQLEQFDMKQSIGKGSYANVYSAINKAEGKNVAIKLYDIFKLAGPNRMMSVKREIQNLKKLDHPNIVKLKYALKDCKHISLVMENPECETLKQFILRQQENKAEQKIALKIIKQLIQAINYCHSQDIVHRDIKAENILIDQDFNIKVIDFGFSTYCNDHKKLSFFCGTPKYMCPQVTQQIPYLGKKADIWSLGVLMYILLFGKYPFKGQTHQEIYKNIQKVNYSLPANEDTQIKLLIQQTLNYDEAKRCSLEEILQNQLLL